MGHTQLSDFKFNEPHTNHNVASYKGKYNHIQFAWHISLCVVHWLLYD